MNSNLHYPKKVLAKIIGGENASDDAIVTLVVLYSHSLVESGVTRILFHMLNTLTPIPPQFNWTKEGNAGEDLTFEEHIDKTGNLEEKLFITINKLNFSQKVGLLEVGFGDWYPNSYRQIRTIGEVRNSIAHAKNLGGVSFRSNAINSDAGLNTYFLTCQSLRMELDEYFEKFIESQIILSQYSANYFGKVLEVRGISIENYIAIAFEEKGLELPELSLSKVELMKRWKN